MTSLTPPCRRKKPNLTRGLATMLDDEAKQKLVGATVNHPVFGEQTLIGQVHNLLLGMYIHTKPGNSWHDSVYPYYQETVERVLDKFEEVFV